MTDAAFADRCALEQENSLLRQQLTEKMHALSRLDRDAFLRDLMGFNHFSSDEFRAACRQHDITFPEDLFVVMHAAFLLDDHHLCTQKHKAERHACTVRILKSALEKECVCYFTAIQGDTAVLINLPDFSTEKRNSIETVLRTACQQIHDLFSATLCCSISAAHGKYSEIPKAYKETESLKNYRIVSGDASPVLMYDNQPEHLLIKQGVPYFELQHQLGCQIRTHDYVSAKRTIHQMLQSEFRDAEPAVQVYIFRACGIVNDLLHVFDSLEETFSTELLVELRAGPRIVNAGSLHLLICELDDILDTIAAYASEKKTEPFWIQQAVDYMDQHFTDPALNIAHLADAVAVSPAYLSRALKGYRNINPLEYIHRKRIDMAKQMLEAGASLKQTQMAVGYGCTATMNRAFQKYETTNPSTFSVRHIETTF